MGGFRKFSPRRASTAGGLRNKDQNAQDSPFSNVVNGFSAQNVQEAVEEALSRSAEKLRETDMVDSNFGRYTLLSNRLFEMDPETSLVVFLTEVTDNA